MGELAVEPVSRMASPGSTVSFKVRTSDGVASTVQVTPDKEADGYVVRLPGGGHEAPVGNGDLTLAIRVPAGAPMA